MTVDRVRDYWNRRPCNIRHSPVSIDEDPAKYSRQVSLRKRIVEPHTRWFAEFPRWAGKRVLDLGCGIGTDSIAFALWGASVTAMDISERSLDIAQKRAEAMHVAPRIHFTCADIEQQPRFGFEQEYYDLVYSFGVIHHTPHPERAVKTAFYYLKAGGEFRLMLYHRKSTKVARILMRHLPDLIFRRKTVDQIVAMESEAQSGCPITYTYTAKAARELLVSCGFSVESITVDHIFPYRVKDYIQYRYRRAFPWNIRWFHHWLEKRLGWHLLIVARKT
jgi:SAM-dependent methyltransferase